jgi:hypothetical protein
VADNWNEKFETPIPLPQGGSLVTLRDAGLYIDKLSKIEQATLPWQLAAKDLLRAATEHLAWRWFARSAIMKALYGETLPPIGKGPRVKKADAWRERRAAKKGRSDGG